MVGHILQFTVTELGTAAFIFRYVGRTLGPGTAFLLGTGQTGMSVTGHNGHQLFLSCGFDAVTICDDHHCFGSFGDTRAHQLLFTLDFHHTKSAAPAGFFGHGIFNFAITLKNNLGAFASLGGW
jgi:hypothetical protein